MVSKIYVVGCGLTGAVIARELAESNPGMPITIWDRRSHIAGNMYDYTDEHGILVHKYGPHTFHTDKSELFGYISKYCRWKEFRLFCKAEIDGVTTPSPFNFLTIDDFYSPDEAAKLKSALTEAYPGRTTVTVVEALKSTDKRILSYAQFLFTRDYSLYTAKQWGLTPEEIDPSVLARVPLRLSYDDGYFDDKYQVMPETTYVDFFTNLLDYPSISVELNTDALSRVRLSESGDRLLVDGESSSVLVVYTGALDELLDCRFGRLPYRSLRFEWKYNECDSFQAAPVVAYPQAKGFTRITEYKKLPVQNVTGTSYAVEFPLPYADSDVIEPYYPVITENSKALYRRYKEQADKISNLIYFGRLADFAYYNMDQALERALSMAKSERMKSALNK